MRILILTIITLMLFSSSIRADVELQPWSDNVFKQIEIEYGEAASKRMRNIYQLIIDNRDKPVRTKLEVVNNALNELPWIADRDKWGAEDYWATPFETLTQFGGDCEDMAIGKQVVLRLMGVSKQNLRLGFVKIRKTGESHMVLVWTNDDRSESLVLDNYVKTIMNGKDRTDLQAILLTDADGNLILLNDDGKNRSIKAEVSARKLQKLETVKQRIVENRKKYEQYNDGNPLY